MKQESNKYHLFRDFLKSEYNRIRNYIRGYFNELSYVVDAEDIIQDVALNVFKKLDLNAHIEDVASYFYRAIRNKIIDLQRKPKMAVSIENFNYNNNENALINNLADDSDDKETIENKEQLKNILMQKIEELSPDEQAIIVETEFEGQTFNELSRRWNIPVGTLLSRKHRAMNKLQDLVIKEKQIHNL